MGPIEQKMFLSDINKKRVTVLGLARSGVGAANILAEFGADVTVTDKKEKEYLKEYLDKLHPKIKTVLGQHPAEIFLNADLLIVSPGVPLWINPLNLARNKGIRIIGELELAYQIITNGLFLKSFSREGLNITDTAISHQPSFLAVTGTNGKSTTTALLYEMVKRSGFNTLLGGNIGNALTAEFLNLKFQISNLDYIVSEVSSFQLESIEAFRPKVATILNITQDHLDRYSSMSDYIEAKCMIFKNQTNEDFLVLNADDPITNIIESEKIKIKSQRPRVFYFSRQRKVEGAYYKDGVIYYNIPELKTLLDFRLYPSNFLIRGVHNIENAMSASLMALLAGCNPEGIEEAVKSFSGLEHRLEFVREIDGVKYINDSKGTNVGAVMKSLEGFEEPVVLIAGGRDKDSDFTILRPLIKSKVKSLILIGEAKEKIKKAVGDLTDVFIQEDLRSAVSKAKEIASPGDVVLLSPACASFDMFRDFEDRGMQFKEIVRAL